MMAAGTAPPPGVLEKLSQFDVPSRTQCVEALAQIPPVLAIPIAIAGTVYLLLGWRFHKALVILNAVVGGGLLGAWLGEVAGSNTSGGVVFGAIAGGMLMGVLAWPLMRGAVSLMGILAGGVIGLAAWGYLAQLTDSAALVRSAWAGAVIGMVALGLLAYANFRLTVILFTAIQGALMIICGALAVLMQSNYLNENIHWAALNNIHMLPALLGIPSVIGFAIQEATLAKQGKKKPTPSPA